MKSKWQDPGYTNIEGNKSSTTTSYMYVSYTSIVHVLDCVVHNTIIKTSVAESNNFHQK